MKLLILIPRGESGGREVPASHVRRVAGAVVADLNRVGAEFTVCAISLTPVSKPSVAPRGDDSSAPEPVGALIVRIDQSALASAAAARCGEVLARLDAIPLVERVHPTSTDAGDHAGVVRLGLIARHANLSREEFREHWLHKHAPLVMANAPLFDRYVSNIPLAETGWDGIVEQWFADETTWLEHDSRILQERAEVRADISRFVAFMRQYAGTPVFSGARSS